MAATNQQNNTIEDAKRLYEHLLEPEYQSYPYSKRDINEGMFLLQQSMSGWIKPRYLIDEDAKQAYKLMDELYTLLTITEDDIDWDTLEGLPENLKERARIGLGIYPVMCGKFHEGQMHISWQINPDGRYYMDEDGYGMTDSQEVTLYGSVDRTGRVVEKFHYNKG